MAEPKRRPERDLSFEAWVAGIERELNKLHGQRFFGVVRVEFAAGEVVRVEIAKSIKDPTSLAE